MIGKVFILTNYVKETIALLCLQTKSLTFIREMKVFLMWNIFVFSQDIFPRHFHICTLLHPVTYIYAPSSTCFKTTIVYAVVFVTFSITLVNILFSWSIIWYGKRFLVYITLIFSRPRRMRKKQDVEPYNLDMFINMRPFFWKHVANVAFYHFQLYLAVFELQFLVYQLKER